MKKTKIKWNKINAQRYISTDERYAIVGRYTYYQGWEPCYLPDGIKGEWVSLDGMYKGKGSLAICREICDEHINKSQSSQHSKEGESMKYQAQIRHINGDLLTTISDDNKKGLSGQ